MRRDHSSRADFSIESPASAAQFSRTLEFQRAVAQLSGPNALEPLPGAERDMTALKTGSARGVAACIAVVLLFSSFTLFSRLGVLESALKPTDLAALRFGVSGIVLLPLLLARGLGPIRLKQAILLTLSGGLAFGLLAYTGFSLAPAAHGAVFLHGMLPFFGTVIGATLLGERPKPQRILGGVVIVSGVALLAMDSGTYPTGAALFGDVSLLVAAFSWTLYGALAQRFGISGIQAATVVAPFAMLAYTPVYFLALDPGLADVPLGQLLAQATFQGLLIGIASLYVYTVAVSSLGATRTALATAMVPILTTIAAVPVLGEQGNVLTWSGVFITTGGMAITFSPRITDFLPTPSLRG